MNLKEAFRFQNKIQSLTEEATSILSRDVNVTKVQNAYLRRKVMAEAEDETTTDVPNHDYPEQITELVNFVIFLFGEKEKLSAAIRKAKDTLSIDTDTETSLNYGRQSLMKLLLRMNDLHDSEVTIHNGGLGYRFNTDGN